MKSIPYCKNISIDTECKFSRKNVYVCRVFSRGMKWGILKEGQEERKCREYRKTLRATTCPDNRPVLLGHSVGTCFCNLTKLPETWQLGRKAMWARKLPRCSFMHNFKLTFTGREPPWQKDLWHNKPIGNIPLGVQMLEERSYLAYTPAADKFVDVPTYALFPFSVYDTIVYYFTLCMHTNM